MNSYIKSLITLFLLSSCFLTTSCSFAIAGYHYAEVQEHLKYNQLPEAIQELEIVSKNMPDYARFHTELAILYSKLGKKDEAWYHIRQALFCNYNDGKCRGYFEYWYDIMVIQQGLETPGTSIEEIKTRLGEPDSEISPGPNASLCYGFRTMSFKDGVLDKCGRIIMFP